MSDRLEFTVGEASDGVSCRSFLRSNGVSARLIGRLKRIDGGITLRGGLLKSIDPVRSGDVVVLTLPSENALNGTSGSVPVKYEDDALIIYDKPCGMPVHPSAKHLDDTLGNIFASAHPDRKFRCINRLDLDTSGLCLVAKNAYAAAVLPKSTKKVYYAAVRGDIPQCGVIEAPIGAAKDSISKRAVCEDGQYARTEYTPIFHSNGYTLLRVVIQTGRTHQIRVHFSYMGYPLAGDALYGGDLSIMKRQALHCGRMRLIHPMSGSEIIADSPLPADMRGLLGIDERTADNIIKG